jgi:hypothetical protein
MEPAVRHRSPVCTVNYRVYVIIEKKRRKAIKMAAAIKMAVFFNITYKLYRETIIGH